MVFLNSVPGTRRRRSLAIHRPAWDAGKNSVTLENIVITRIIVISRIVIARTYCTYFDLAFSWEKEEKHHSTLSTFYSFIFFRWRTPNFFVRVTRVADHGVHLHWRQYLPPERPLAMQRYFFRKMRWGDKLYGVCHIVVSHRLGWVRHRGDEWVTGVR